MESGGTGDLHVDTVPTCFNASLVTCNNISLAANAGSITDGHNLRLGGNTPNVIGATIDPQALGGSIGAADGSHHPKVSSSKGSPRTRSLTLADHDAHNQNATPLEPAVN